MFRVKAITRSRTKNSADIALILACDHCGKSIEGSAPASVLFDPNVNQGEAHIVHSDCVVAYGAANNGGNLLRYNLDPDSIMATI